MDGWKMSFLWKPYFQVRTVSFREGTHEDAPHDPSWLLASGASAGPTYVFRPPLMASIALGKKRGKNTSPQCILQGSYEISKFWPASINIRYTVNYVYIWLSFIEIVYSIFKSTHPLWLCTVFNMLGPTRRRITPHRHWESSSRQNFVWRLRVKASSFDTGPGPLAFGALENQGQC